MSQSKWRRLKSKQIQKTKKKTCLLLLLHTSLASREQRLKAAKRGLLWHSRKSFSLQWQLKTSMSLKLNKKKLKQKLIRKRQMSNKKIWRQLPMKLYRENKFKQKNKSLMMFKLIKRIMRMNKMKLKLKKQRSQYFWR